MNRAGAAGDLLEAAREIETGRLASLLQQVPAAHWTRLDAALRAPGLRAAWAALDLAAAVDARRWEALVLAASHPDGRVRQAALVELAPLGDGRALPALLLRLNDAVPAVRATARAALLSYMSTEYAEHFVAARPLVEALVRKTRVDLAPVHAWIVQLVAGGQREVGQG